MPCCHRVVSGHRLTRAVFPSESIRWGIEHAEKLAATVLRFDDLPVVCLRQSRRSTRLVRILLEHCHRWRHLGAARVCSEFRRFAGSVSENETRCEVVHAVNRSEKGYRCGKDNVCERINTSPQQTVSNRSNGTCSHYLHPLIDSLSLAMCRSLL